MPATDVAWPVLVVWSVRCAVACILLAICVSDVRTRRIPNRLVVAGLVLAFAWQFVGPAGNGLFASERPGATGPFQALAGSAGAFAAFLVLHVSRVMGAGDVKLAAFVGAVFGLQALPALLLSIFATGGLLAAVRLANRDRRGKALENLRVIVMGAAAVQAGGEGPRFDPGADTADRLPFAVAITGGAIVLAAAQSSGWMP